MELIINVKLIFCSIIPFLRNRLSLVYKKCSSFVWWIVLTKFRILKVKDTLSSLKRFRMYALSPTLYNTLKDPNLLSYSLE